SRKPSPQSPPASQTSAPARLCHALVKSSTISTTGLRASLRQWAFSIARRSGLSATLRNRLRTRCHDFRSRCSSLGITFFLRLARQARRQSPESPLECEELQESQVHGVEGSARGAR